MRKKRTIGIIMFLAGILLKELSYIIDIWIIHFLISVLASIIGLIGLVMATKAMVHLDDEKKKKTEDGSPVLSEASPIDPEQKPEQR